MFDLIQVQQALREFELDGWLLVDFRGRNVLAHRVLDMPENTVGSRRFAYFIPADGQPRKLVHRIESGCLDHLPGEKDIYLRWQEFENGIKDISDGGPRIAMEYSPNNGNPYVSIVDGGTIELVRSYGKEVVSSGDLIQYFEARLTDEQWQLHLQADSFTQKAFEVSWDMIRRHVLNDDPLTESDVQDRIMQHFDEHGMTTYHPPIVAVNENSGDPHYEPKRGSDKKICRNDFVLIDLWAKMNIEGGIYSDNTKVGFVGSEVPSKHQKIFDIVAAARDAGVEKARSAFAKEQELFGWEVDQATRDVIDQAGYGEFFVHRTGHNIGQETHGNGAHMDNLETKEDRRVMKGTCFSIEPGIYLDEFGVRCEVDVFVDYDGKVHVTGGIQSSVLAILGTD